MKKRPAWLVLSITCVAVGVLSVVPLVLTLRMAFDAPGSEKNTGLIAVVVIMGFFPISCLLGAILPWILQRWSFAGKLFLIPVLMPSRQCWRL